MPLQASCGSPFGNGSPVIEDFPGSDTGNGVLVGVGSGVLVTAEVGVAVGEGTVVGFVVEVAVGSGITVVASTSSDSTSEAVAVVSSIGVVVTVVSDAAGF